MTLHQLKVFTMVADLGSFTEAGVTLDLRQPSVTALIQGLERDLKIKLFDRMGHKIHLTGAGERLLPYAKNMLAESDQILEEIDEIRGLNKGKLSVGGSGLASHLFLPVVIQKFKFNFSGIEIHLEIQRSKQLEKMILDGYLDLAIMASRPQSPLLVSEFYRAEKIVAIAPPNHPLAKRQAVPLELLAKEPLVITHKGNLVRDMVERIFSERGLPFKAALEIGSDRGARSAIKSALVGGLGVGFITRCYFLPEFQTGEIKQLKVPGLDVRRDLYIVSHKNRQDSKLVQAFVNLLWDYKKSNQF